MRVAVGSDHAGVALAEELAAAIVRLGHEVVDCGTHAATPVDYPDIAEAVALAVTSRRAERGVLLCGSGVGAAVAANKLPGVRAGLCHDTYSAHQGVEHDDINIVVLGARVVGPELAKELVTTFLAARFSGEGRHVRRLDKVRELEGRFAARFTMTTGEKR
jgi:RpiB/LacA/LacB family sugar-phosphate isomerase